MAEDSEAKPVDPADEGKPEVDEPSTNEEVTTTEVEEETLEEAEAGGEETAADETGEEEEEEDVEISFEVEDAGPCCKKFKVHISKSDGNEAFEDSFEEFRKEAVVPGFRPGRVPRWLLERKFGKQLNQEIRNRLLQAGLKHVMKKGGCTPISTPDYDDEAIQFDPEKDFDFEVTLYVRPEFELENYLDLEIEIPDLDPADEMVESEIQGFLRSRAELIDAEEGAIVDENDIAACGARLELDGETIWQEEELNVHVSPTTRGRSVIPEIVDLLTGLKIGDEKTETITVTDRYPQEEHRGKEAQLWVKLEGLQKPQVPELTDELAQSVGFDSVEEFRENLEEQLESQIERLTDEMVTGRIREKLEALAEFDLPEGLIEKYVEERVTQQRAALELEGGDEAQREEGLEAFRTRAREELEGEMKRTFVMQYICEKEGVVLSDDEIDDHVEQIAKRTGQDPFDLYEQYEQDGTLETLRERLLEEKTFELLKQNAAVVKVSREESDDVAEAEEGASAGSDGETPAEESSETET